MTALSLQADDVVRADLPFQSRQGERVLILPHIGRHPKHLLECNGQGPLDWSWSLQAPYKPFQQQLSERIMSIVMSTVFLF